MPRQSLHWYQSRSSLLKVSQKKIANFKSCRLFAIGTRGRRRQRLPPQTSASSRPIMTHREGHDCRLPAGAALRCAAVKLDGSTAQQLTASISMQGCCLHPVCFPPTVFCSFLFFFLFPARMLLFCLFPPIWCHVAALQEERNITGGTLRDGFRPILKPTAPTVSNF